VLDIKPEPTEPVTDRASPQIYTKQTRPRPRLALAQTAQGKCLPRLPLGAGEISAVPVAALVSPRRPVTQPKLGPRLVSREGGREAERKVRTSLSRRPAGKEPRGTCSRCACGVAEVAGANCLILTSRIPGRYGTCSLPEPRMPLLNLVRSIVPTLAGAYARRTSTGILCARTPSSGCVRTDTSRCFSNAGCACGRYYGRTTGLASYT